MTVEVEMACWWAISVIEVFSINFCSIFIDERSFGEGHFRAMIALETAFLRRGSIGDTNCFKVRNFRQFLKLIFLNLASAIRTR